MLQLSIYEIETTEIIFAGFSKTFLKRKAEKRAEPCFVYSLYLIFLVLKIFFLINFFIDFVNMN